MSDDRELIRESVRRMTRRAVTPHLAAMEKHPWVALPDAPLRALDELGLEGIDARDEDGRRTLASALGALAGESPALASLVLADAAARALAGEDAPAGRGAFPLYHDRADDRHPAVVAGDLHGTAEMVVGAPVAQWAVVPARNGALSAGVVRLDGDGVRIGEPIRTLGMRGAHGRAFVYLLAMALPALTIVTLQAFISRANANWAATAYPGATVLVCAWLLGIVGT